MKFAEEDIDRHEAESLPSRERGLKSMSKSYALYKLPVAPLAGAWIEISAYPCRLRPSSVAPLAGAWIEIADKALCYCINLSLPSRERGLKSTGSVAVVDSSKSLPSRERGLKSQLGWCLPELQGVAPLAGAWIEMLL